MDMARGKAFYEAVFDQKMPVVDMGPRQMAMFSMEMGVPGVGGALVIINSLPICHAFYILLAHWPA